MTLSVSPIIHVPDVKAAADWYQSVGFDLTGWNACGEEVWDWASLAFGDSRVMFNIGGQPSDAHRREVDLYVQVDDLAAARAAVDGRAEIVEDVHDTEYGMREFIFRDLNRFWITFGQPMESQDQT